MQNATRNLDQKRKGFITFHVQPGTHKKERGAGPWKVPEKTCGTLRPLPQGRLLCASPQHQAGKAVSQIKTLRLERDLLQSQAHHKWLGRT